jgi:transcription elongation factor GreA
MGSRVTVRDQSGDEDETYTIVGSQEADPIHGKISDESPLGRSLMGHAKGDKVSFEAPMGVLHYEITNVEN